MVMGLVRVRAVHVAGSSCRWKSWLIEICTWLSTEATGTQSVPFIHDLIVWSAHFFLLFIRDFLATSAHFLSRTERMPRTLPLQAL